jgi:endonuclease/exonuclease/phosphatase family metal-dependent hydrolase
MPRRMTRGASIGAVACLALALVTHSALGADPPRRDLRIAVFNIQVLSTAKIMDVDALGRGRDPQLIAAAAIIRDVRPDVLILNELWHDVDAHEQKGVPLEENALRFARAYLEPGDDGVTYPHAFAAPCNTGRLSGFDLNRDDTTATAADRGTQRYADDAWGWGREPGEFSIGLLSRVPIDTARVRTFARFLWSDLPGHHMPVEFYGPEVTARMPLSSKAHWDLPLVVGGDTLHVFMCVPTPGIFDGPEDRNGLRNFDEVGFWVRYLDDDPALYDDRGGRAGYRSAAPFVIAGDLNAFEEQDTRIDGRVAIRQLLDHPHILDTGPWLTSPGAAHGGPTGAPAFRERHTLLAGTFRGRFDYILPARGLEVAGGGVVWPDPVADPAGHERAETASDHRLVWLDLTWP